MIEVYRGQCIVVALCTYVQTVVPRHFLLRDHCLLHGHGQRIVRVRRDYRGRPDQRSGGAKVWRVSVAHLSAGAGNAGQIRGGRRLWTQTTHLTVKRKQTVEQKMPFYTMGVRGAT